jgi:hypothetical protein
MDLGKFKVLLTETTTVLGGIGAAVAAVAAGIQWLRPLLEPALGAGTALWVGAGLPFVGAVLIVAWLYSSIQKRSRLLRPEIFDLKATTPRDLIGRDEDVRQLKELIEYNQLVFLSGESGSGKSALVAIGLISKLRDEGRMLPILVSRYGTEWDSGPLREAVMATWEACDENQRKTIEQPTRPLVAQATPDSLRQTLDRLAATGWTPLLIFDQFDDYQARHRDRFISTRGEWITPARLKARNPFWKAVAAMLEGPCRALIVTRSDTAAGLHSVRLVEPASRGLDRLHAAFLRPLLDRLAPEDAKPPVIANPQDG